MPFFEVRPVEAQQYTGRESIDAIAELVKRFRTHASYQSNPLTGVLRFYGSGEEVHVAMGSWVVAFGADVVMMSQAEFDQVVTPPPAEPGHSESI